MANIFLNTPNDTQGTLLSAANTARDGSGAMQQVWTAGLNGSLFQGIILQVPGVAVQDTIRLFWRFGSTTLFHEVNVPPFTPANGTPIVPIEYYPNTSQVYPTGWSLWLSTHVGQATNYLVLGGNY